MTFQSSVEREVFLTNSAGKIKISICKGIKHCNPLRLTPKDLVFFFCCIFLFWSGLLFYASTPLFQNGNGCCHCVYWYCVRVFILFFYFIWANNYIAWVWGEILNFEVVLLLLQTAETFEVGPKLHWEMAMSLGVRVWVGIVPHMLLSLNTWFPAVSLFWEAVKPSQEVVEWQRCRS